MGRNHRPRGGTGRVVLWTALAVTGVGAGVAATLSTGSGLVRALGGAFGGVAGFAAAAWVDRVRQRREALATAVRGRLQVLDAVSSGSGEDRSAFGVLLAAREVAPFRGRAADLAWLEDWCNDCRAHPVAVVVGPAGVGKSRLVTQFAGKRPAPWVAGWLRTGCGVSALAAIRACHDPAVILVDDADERSDLIALLEDLAVSRNGSSVRIVLITRASGLRARVARSLEPRYRSVLDNAPEHLVSPFGSDDDHARWFGEAVRAYAKARKTPPPDLLAGVSRGPGDEADEPILTVQAQALLAVLDSERGRPMNARTQVLPFDEVAAALFSYEQHRWSEAAGRADWGLTDLTPAVQGRAIAALLLTGADSEDQAIAALRRVPDLSDSAAERLANITRWAAHLYPGDPPWPIRVRPQMLAEWFLITQITRAPALAHGMGDLATVQKARVLALFAHASDHMPSAVHLFTDLIATDIMRLAPTAADAASTARSGRPLLDAGLASLIGRASWTAEALAALDNQPSVGLLPRTRVAVTSVRVENLRVTGTPEELAAALQDLGNELRDLGCPREGLAAAEEALGLRRILADGNAAHQPYLAGALQNLGRHLSELGRAEEALTADEEAIRLWQTLTDVANQPYLAGTLQSLGNSLRALGRPGEALAADERALDLYRTLADGNPAHQPHLAATLQSVGFDLGELGRYREARAFTDEALGLWQTLADSNPAHQPGLAATLQNVGLYQFALGRTEEALAADERALDLYRTLADDNPAHRPGLARALQDLQMHLTSLGRYAEALTVGQEAIGLYRTLADDNPAHQPGLARTLNTLGSDLCALGRPREALTVTQEALDLCRTLAADNPLYQPYLAATLQNLGNDLGGLGRHGEALTATEEALGLWQTLADSNSVHQPYLAVTLRNRGIRLLALGRPREALAAAEKALSLYDKLADAEPDLYEETYQQVLAQVRRAHDLDGDHATSARLHLGRQHPIDEPRHDGYHEPPSGT